jgi:hypothetical protein
MAVAKPEIEKWLGWWGRQTAARKERRMSSFRSFLVFFSVAPMAHDESEIRFVIPGHPLGIRM